MKKVTANHAKAHFDELLEKVQDEPIEIQKNRRSVAVLMSYQSYIELKALKLDLEIAHRDIEK